MATFFDFNLPCLEGETKIESEKKKRKDSRLKSVVKLMELGYSGVAYNHTIKGVMADSDRCSIHLFPLSSLLKVAPTISNTVKFHRELLGVPLNTSFRQYTRLTLMADSAIHVSALNSGNPVLKTYDLIVVRPLSQNAFDQACKVSEVHMISIDFSQKLPFRLKSPMVKAAIERGIYFEITYSHLLSNVHERRQILSGAKLLVDWTRGKNLILSSDAVSVNEIRGPYDVMNLSTLLGISMEQAKKAISMNCRSLIASALQKKQCYKEAIRIERISPMENPNPKNSWYMNRCDWDQISSGEGDLQLDGIASAIHEMSNKIDSSPIQGVLPKNNDLFISAISNFQFNLTSPNDNQTLEPISPFVGRDGPSPVDGMEGGAMVTHVMPLKHVHNTSNQNIEEILLDPESCDTSIDVPMKEVLVQEEQQELKDDALLPPSTVSLHENYESEVPLHKMEGDPEDKTFVVCNEPLETSTNNWENMHDPDVIMDYSLSKEIFEITEEKKQGDENFISNDVSFNRILNKVEEQKIIGDVVPSHDILPRVKPGKTKGRAPPEILLPFKGLLRKKLFKKKGRRSKS